ncbi:hypothetical protein [Streptomyces sp. LN549]|uniref:hypothetical protein n=1 Tax=Streptomyces sp. LN549 TaxID=3112979 RepID=UPI0037202894
MTTAVAGAATAPRLRRGAAGRRALQVVLFLGGLLALGLLFGTRAQADQQPDQQLVQHPEQQLLQQPAQQQPHQPHQPVRQLRDAAADAVAPAASTPPAPPVREVSPVREALPVGEVPSGRVTVRQLTRPVGQVVEKTVGAAVTGLRDITVALPGERPLPIPSLPSAPEAPAASQAGPAPVSDAPDRGAPGFPAAPRPVTASVSLITPAPAVFPASSGPAAAPHREAAADHRPAPRGPFGPDGGQGRSVPAEVHPPRGGDQHAVPFADGTCFGLVRGAGLPATGAPVRDRSGEILEFPG